MELYIQQYLPQIVAILYYKFISIQHFKKANDSHLSLGNLSISYTVLMSFWKECRTIGKAHAFEIKNQNSYINQENATKYLFLSNIYMPLCG